MASAAQDFHEALDFDIELLQSALIALDDVEDFELPKGQEASRFPPPLSEAALKAKVASTQPRNTARNTNWGVLAFKACMAQAPYPDSSRR